MSNLTRYYYTVYTKPTWRSGWIKQPYIEPLTVYRSVSPAIDRAQLKVRFGVGNWENGVSMTDAGNMADLTDHYVMITAASSVYLTDETILFVGVLGQMDFDLHGQTYRGRSSDQVINAYGLETVLETRIEGAHVRSVSDQSLKQIDKMPVFNLRTVNNEVEGNMSTSDEKFFSEDLGQDYYTRVFAADSGTTTRTATWSVYHIIQYIVGHCQAEGVGGVRFNLEIPQQLATYLKTQTGVYNLEGLTLRQALNMLASRSRGLCWWIDVGYDTMIIRIDTMLSSDLEVGDVTIPASTRRRRRLDLWNEAAFSKVTIIQDDSQRFDKIVVRGASMKVCGTWDYSNGDLEKAWTTAEQTNYEDAAKNTTGYGALSDTAKAKLNDSYRGADRFNKVFTTFKVPSDFNWTLDSNNANPKWSPTSGILSWTENAEYFNSGKRFLNMIPLKEGIDYSTYAPTNRNTDNEIEFRRPFVLAQNADSKWVYVDKIQATPATVRMLQAGLGVVIKFNPAYIFSGTSWSDEIGNWTGDLATYGVDYTNMILTAMVETDQRFELINTISTSQVARVKVINVPDAELWYVVPGTVIDVDDEGAQVTYGSYNEIRNDVDQLEAILTAASAWYGSTRYKVKIKAGNAEPIVSLGDILEYARPTDLDGDYTGSAITAIGYVLTGSPSMSITTDNAELDIAGVYASSRNASPTIPSLAVAAREITDVKKQISEIKEDQSRTPVRSEAGGSGGPGFSIRKAYAKADAGAGSTIVCYIDSDSGVAADEITVYCEICNGSDLNAASPLLENGDLIHVYNDAGVWRSVQTFDSTGSCA